METIVDLKKLKAITNSDYYPLYKNKSRYLVLYGGAGSGKSHFVCEKNLFRILKEDNHRILVMRKVARTSRRSTYQLFTDYIYRWGISNLFKFNKTEMDIECVNGNRIYFAGMSGEEEREKIKSIEGVTSVWLEEASEFSLKDFQEINRRMRGESNNYKQIILSYNPISIFNWTQNQFIEGENPQLGEILEVPDKKLTILRTNYKSNIFLDADYIEMLESYTGTARMIYTLGEPGKLEHSVYSNWDLIDNFPETDKEIYGLDFGFTNPQALIKVYLRENDLYLEERMYERKQTIPELISFLENEKLKDRLIIADSEAPASIAEIKRGEFYNIIPCIKGPGSVEEGIKFMEGLKIHITKGSTNLIKEVQSYQRKVDKDGNVLEVVEKSNDHLLDGARMAVFTHYYNREPEPNFFA